MLRIDLLLYICELGRLLISIAGFRLAEYDTGFRLNCRGRDLPSDLRQPELPCGLAVVDAAFGEVVPPSKRTLVWGKEGGQIGLRP
jgi:hypothetical protein